MVYVLLRAIEMLVITTLLYLAECVCSWEICKMNMSDGYCGHFAFYGIILAILQLRIGRLGISYLFLGNHHHGNK